MSPMLPAPRASLTANSADFETFPLVKPTGFREYDARWWFGIHSSDKAPELNLLGVQALGLGLGTLIHDYGVAPRIVVGHDFRFYSTSIKQALILGLIQAGMEVHDIGLQVPLVFMPCNPVDSDRRRLLQVEEAFSQAIFVDVMQQGRELERAVLSGSFTHTMQSA